MEDLVPDKPLTTSEPTVRVRVSDRGTYRLELTVVDRRGNKARDVFVLVFDGPTR